MDSALTYKNGLFILCKAKTYLTDTFPSVFWVHGQHGDVSSAKHFFVHVKLTYYGPDTLLSHHGLRQTKHKR